MAYKCSKCGGLEHNSRTCKKCQICGLWGHPSDFCLGVDSGSFSNENITGGTCSWFWNIVFIGAVTGALVGLYCGGVAIVPCAMIGGVAGVVMSLPCGVIRGHTEFGLCGCCQDISENN